jgi:hypothetical protein
MAEPVSVMLHRSDTADARRLALVFIPALIGSLILVTFAFSMPDDGRYWVLVMGALVLGLGALGLHRVGRKWLSIGRLDMTDEMMKVSISGRDFVLHLHRPFSMTTWVLAHVLARTQDTVFEVVQDGRTIAFFYPMSLADDAEQVLVDRWPSRANGVFLGTMGAKIRRRLAAARVASEPAKSA